jgi:nucleotide-binding universal stress UspA family protein
VVRPVLVCASTFREPERFVIAFDGSFTGRKMVQAVAQSPLLVGLRCEIVMASENSAVAQEHLSWAGTVLKRAGFEVLPVLTAGEPEVVVLEHVRNEAADLLVMGAYGHSRIRQLIVGSTTTSLLRTSPASVLVLR